MGRCQVLMCQTGPIPILQYFVAQSNRSQNQYFFKASCLTNVLYFFIVLFILGKTERIEMHFFTL